MFGVYKFCLLRPSREHSKEMWEDMVMSPVQLIKNVKRREGFEQRQNAD